MTNSILSLHFLQSYLSLVHHFQYFVVLGRADHRCKIDWDPLWILTCHLISISFFHINFDKASYPINGIVARLLGVVCVECLVGDNNINQSFIEICNGCLYMVLYWQDILGIIYDTWCDLANISMVIWYTNAP